jgi:hypothetical protein
MAEYQKSYRIKYHIKCRFQNFFGKEIVVKNCMSEIHAKAKLDDYCRKNYPEYVCIIVSSCSQEGDVMDMFSDLFGNSSSYDSNPFMKDLINNLKNKKK